MYILMNKSICLSIYLSIYLPSRPIVAMVAREQTEISQPLRSFRQILVRAKGGGVSTRQCLLVHGKHSLYTRMKNKLPKIINIIR